MEINEQVVEVVEQIKRNRFDVVLAKNAHDATHQILEMIPKSATVGVANSVTVRQIGILEALKNRGNKLIDPISIGYGLVKFNAEALHDTNRRSVEADVFLSGTNAITEDGKLVNIDGAGNRVVGIIWNPGHSIVVASRNKIVKDVSAAIYRIKNIVTPTFAKRRKLTLPCAKAGRCVDCNVPERACNITSILEKKPVFKKLTIVIIDEDLGLGWDIDWLPERIAAIRRKYEQYDWPYSSDYTNYKKLRANEPP
jgi:hypothetical protein